MIERLEEFTGYHDWISAVGPDSGHGVDFWFYRLDEQGIKHIAYINQDQDYITLTITNEENDREENAVLSDEKSFLKSGGL